MNLLSYSQIVARCDDLAPIDYFFAKNLVENFQAKTQEDLDVALMCVVALSWAQRQGHSCLPLQSVANTALWSDSAGSKAGFRFPELNTLLRVITELLDCMPSPHALALQEGRLYTARALHFEQSIKARLHALHRVEPIVHKPFSQISEHWSLLFPSPESTDEKHNETDWQQVAVVAALHQSLLLLTGGPGTGKTYTVSRMLLSLQLCADQALNIGLAAPTGKAAQRLSESIKANLQELSQYPGLSEAAARIPQQASTVHRLLGLREGRVGCKYHQDNPLPLDVLVVDECSMLDLALFTRLLRAVSNTCRLVLVGDSAQLPSVESGNVLPMLTPREHNQLSNQQIEWMSTFGLALDLPIQSQMTGYAIALQRSRRFDQSLGHLANEIQDSVNDRARAASTWQSYRVLSAQNEQFKHIDYPQLESQLRAWIEDVFVPLTTLSSANEALKAAQQFRLLCVTRQGPMGVNNLNQLIDSALKRRVHVTANQAHYHGRLIMITRNLPSLGLFNGDMGIVWRDQQGRLALHFASANGTNTRVFELERIVDLESVFAMTVHKSQGSEYQHVVVIIPNQGADRLLTNELIYTAITRSKRYVTLVCNESRFIQSIVQKTQRWSGISPVVAAS